MIRRKNAAGGHCDQPVSKYCETANVVSGTPVKHLFSPLPGSDGTGRVFPRIVKKTRKKMHSKGSETTLKETDPDSSQSDRVRSTTMAKRHNKKIKGAHAVKNAREARARKNANQKLTRLIDTALVKLDEAGKLYSCKVYLVLQTHKGQWTTYHNARGQDWPPSYSQIKCFPGARRLGPETFDADSEQTRPSHNANSPLAMPWYEVPTLDSLAEPNCHPLQTPSQMVMDEVFQDSLPELLSTLSSA
ncbi:hypothetical protein ZTR_10491 [Talaromyces verruculosus]|nr:hypothetical protein ZTR_10491 [Talaromyces verruculosus]